MSEELLGFVVFIHSGLRSIDKACILDRDEVVVGRVFALAVVGVVVEVQLAEVVAQAALEQISECTCNENTKLVK